jgi:hypothetical protein
MPAAIYKLPHQYNYFISYFTLGRRVQEENRSGVAATKKSRSKTTVKPSKAGTTGYLFD